MVPDSNQPQDVVAGVSAHSLHGQPMPDGLFEQIPFALVLIDATSPDFRIRNATLRARILQANPTASPQDRPWRDCFPEAHAPGVLALFQEVQRAGEARETSRFPLPDVGSAGAVTDADGVLWWIWRVAPLRDRAGTIRWLLASATDVTRDVLLEQERAEHARVRTQMELRAAELEAVIDSMTDAFWIENAAGEILFYNASATKIADLDRTEGGPLRTIADLFARVEILDIDGRPPSEAMLPAQHIFSTGKPAPVTRLHVRNRHTGREFWLSVAGSPVIDYDGNLIGAAMMARDMTELHQAEALKDTFLSMVAHELRTPLTAIKGYTQFASKQASRLDTPAPALEATLAKIGVQVQRLARLADDLLDVTRARNGQLPLRLNDCDLAAIVSSCVQEQRLSTGQRVELTLPDAPVIVCADADRLRQVFDNILNNAFKYAESADPVRVHLSVRGGDAVVAVRDTGPGIPEAEQAAIFDLFYRARSPTTSRKLGLGLGLYICRVLVEQHGGRLWVESREGKGSTFYVALPLAS